MNKREICDLLDALWAPYAPIERTYIVEDELTAPDGKRVGDKVAYYEWPSLASILGLDESA